MVYRAEVFDESVGRLLDVGIPFELLTLFGRVSVLGDLWQGWGSAIKQQTPSAAPKETGHAADLCQGLFLRLETFRLTQ